MIEKLITRDQEKLEMKNEIRSLRALFEASLKINEEKSKENEKEVRGLRELIENFNENRVFSLENENKKFKDEIERFKRENKEIQELLDKKSKELSFLYADAENTKESIISELKNLKELKDKLYQEKSRIEQDKRNGDFSPEKEKKQAFIINEPNGKQETKSNFMNNKGKFEEKSMNGRFSKASAEILLENKPLNTSQPIMLKDLKENTSSKGLFYQDISTSEKFKQNLMNNSQNSIVSSKFLIFLLVFFDFLSFF